jgi:hypothetical protein
VDDMIQSDSSGSGYGSPSSQPQHHDVQVGWRALQQTVCLPYPCFSIS